MKKILNAPLPKPDKNLIQSIMCTVCIDYDVEIIDISGITYRNKFVYFVDVRCNKCQNTWTTRWIKER